MCRIYHPRMASQPSRSSPGPLVALALAAIVVTAACGPSLGSGSPTPTTTPTASPVASPSANPTPAPTASPEPSTEPTPAPATAWRQLEPAGSAPSAREDGTWTEHPGSRTAYLFGGRDGSTILDDLWAFDLDANSWTRLAPEGQKPPARFGHEAVWVDGVGVVIFAGQAGPTTFFGDLWAYDPDAHRWQRLAGDGARPIARYGSCAALGPDGRLWISHGFTEDGTRFADTRAYDFTAGRWSDETPAGQAPVNRCLHGCWWTDDGQFVLYAGQTTGVEALGDLWSLSDAGMPSATWARQGGDLPLDRNLYAFARHGGEFVVVGGRGLEQTFLDDAFSVDATSLAIEPLEPTGSKPPGRGGAMLIDDPAGGRVILFGGKTASGSLADLWELSLP
jgi:hypothetical protein